jgi:hypothetical protein
VSFVGAGVQFDVAGVVACSLTLIVTRALLAAG